MSPSEITKRNIKKQVHNLAGLLNIELSKAYEIVAWAIYRCPNYNDLLNRLQDESVYSKWFVLAEMSGTKDPSKIANFKTFLPAIVDRISSRLMCNADRFVLSNMTYEIFDIEPPAELFHDLFPGVSAPEWRQVKIDDVSRNTILESYIRMGGVTYKLLAISVFRPDMWPIFSREQKEVLKKALDNYCEVHLLAGNRNQFLKVINECIERGVLGDDNSEFDLSDVTLSRAEGDLQNSIREFLDCTGFYAYSSEERVPVMQLNAESLALFNFIVIGYPTEDNERAVDVCSMMQEIQSLSSGTQVFLLDGMPMKFEWLTKGVDSYGGDYIDDISSLLSGVPGFSPPVVSETDEVLRLGFFRPAAHFEIREELDLRPAITTGCEAWLVQTDNSMLAEKVVSSIAARNLFINESCWGTQELICKVVLEQEAADHIGCSVNFNVRGNRNESHINLVMETVQLREEGKVTILLTVASSFVTILQKVGSEAFISAMRNGLISEVAEGTFDDIHSLPEGYTINLPVLSELDAARVNQELDIGHIDQLFENLTMANYERN